MATAAELLSKRNMRILNLFGLVLVIIAWLTRFYYFTRRDDIIENADGTITNIEVQDGWWAII